MGEHDTWWNFLGYLPGWDSLTANLKYYLSREQGSMVSYGTDIFPSQFTLAHVLSAMMVAAFLIYGAIRYKGSLARAGRGAIVPPSTFNLRNLFEMFAEAVLSIAEGVMGKKNAQKYL